jgi:hypothetical protein
MVARACRERRIADAQDVLALWEELLASAAQSLRIKYGLRNDPSEFQVRAWAELTRDFIKRGVNRDKAGEQAAQKLFVDYRTHVYATEADTIEMLLLQAERK